MCKLSGLETLSSDEFGELWYKSLDGEVDEDPVSALVDSWEFCWF